MTYLSAVILLGILIFVHELGHFMVAKLSGVKVLKFSLGFGPRIIGKRMGDTEYIISAVPLGGYVKMLGEDPEDEFSPQEKDVAYSSQSIWKRFFIVLTGPLFNLLLAYVIFIFFIGFQFPVRIPTFDSFTPTIDKVRDDSPAMKAGLKKGDVIVAVDGQSITTFIELTKLINQNPGKEITVEIKRGDERLVKKIIPEATVVKNEKGEEVEVGMIGIVKDSNMQEIKGKGMLFTPLLGLKATYEWSLFVLETIGKFITGQIGTKNIGGPIAIVEETSKAASQGVLPYFMFMAIISIHLGILNLLPIPILDGGHIAFLGIEAVRGKPLTHNSQILAQKVGLVLLLALMTLAFYNDIMRLITG
jgi:regulator of sigma E protease